MYIIVLCIINFLDFVVGPTKTLAKYMKDRLVSECMNREKQSMDEILHRYKLFCCKMGYVQIQIHP